MKTKNEKPSQKLELKEFIQYRTF